MEQEITTECPRCHAVITALFSKTSSMLLEDNATILRIGFVAEIEHSCQ